LQQVRFIFQKYSFFPKLSQWDLAKLFTDSRSLMHWFSSTLELVAYSPGALNTLHPASKPIDDCA
jgi:hypothetical protein|tara:strand:+ start:529 stop:723 length:195 start_codon:yes stop_codon:yes gene_type:complete